MRKIELNNIIQQIDFKQSNKEQMLKQIVEVYCKTADTYGLNHLDITEQILKVTQAAILLHNTNLDKSQKHLKWDVPKQIEPKQLALYLVNNIKDLDSIMDKDVDFMRLVWECAIGYSKYDIKCVRNEIIKIKRHT